MIFLNAHALKPTSLLIRVIISIILHHKTKYPAFELPNLRTRNQEKFHGETRRDHAKNSVQFTTENTKEDPNSVLIK